MNMNTHNLEVCSTVLKLTHMEHLQAAGSSSCINEHRSVTIRAAFGAGSLMHTGYTDRSLVELPPCHGLLSLKALDLTACAALVTANLAGCESLQTVSLDGCTGLRKLRLPR
jgi:hypothetical protein